MVRKGKEEDETSLHDVKIKDRGSLEDIDKNSIKENEDRDGHGDDDEDEEEEEGEENAKKNKQRKIKLKQNRNSKEAEYNDDSDDKSGREREESIAIPIEEEAAADAPDGKRAQRQANTYAAKKTVAQGMMDIALITANANQLRYIIEFNRHSSTFYVNVILIILSLLLQVGVGLSLIFKGRLDLRGESKHRNAKMINNYVVVGVFLVTIINVFIASFTVTGGGNANTADNGDGHGVKM